MTQQTLAESAGGMSQTTLRRLIRGRPVSLESLVRLCETLGMDFWPLLAPAWALHDLEIARRLPPAIRRRIEAQIEAEREAGRAETPLEFYGRRPDHYDNPPPDPNDPVMPLDRRRGRR